jgi:hypothetical protein
VIVGEPEPVPAPACVDWQMSTVAGTADEVTPSIDTVTLFSRIAWFAPAMMFSAVLAPAVAANGVTLDAM